MIRDAGEWAVSEFRGTPGLQALHQQRLVHTATRLAARPSGSLPQRLDWAELKAAYRLADRAAANPDALQTVHRQRTRERMAAAPGPVLTVHDTTTLRYTGHRAVADRLGPIADSDARGFLRHNSPAVDPDGHHLLGPIHQQTFCREPKPDGETRARRYRRGRRESDIWLAGVTACGVMPDDACRVRVGDRGADFFGPMATCRSQRAHFPIRPVQDRASVPADDAEQKYLISRARSVSAVATKEVVVASKAGFVAAYATNGNFQWVKTLPQGTPTALDLTPQGLAVQTNGDVVLAGYQNSASGNPADSYLADLGMAQSNQWPWVFISASKKIPSATWYGGGTLLATTNLISPSWQIVVTNWPATNHQYKFTDSGTNAQKFYRLSVT